MYFFYSFYCVLMNIGKQVRRHFSLFSRHHVFDTGRFMYLTQEGSCILHRRVYVFDTGGFMYLTQEGLCI